LPSTSKRPLKDNERRIQFRIKAREEAKKPVVDYSIPAGNKQITLSLGTGSKRTPPKTTPTSLVEIPDWGAAKSVPAESGVVEFPETSGGDDAFGSSVDFGAFQSEEEAAADPFAGSQEFDSGGVFSSEDVEVQPSVEAKEQAAEHTADGADPFAFESAGFDPFAPSTVPATDT